MERIELTSINDWSGKMLTEVYYGFTKDEAIADMRHKLGSNMRVYAVSEGGEK